MPLMSSSKTRASSRRAGLRGSPGGDLQAGLTSRQTEELKKRLIDLQGEIRRALSGRATAFHVAAQNESLIKGDDAEVAEKQRLNNAQLQELDMLKNRLELVERALLKMAEGVYGICEETDEAIGFERLKVIPWARFAVNVQEKMERRYRDFRHLRGSLTA